VGGVYVMTSSIAASEIGSTNFFSMFLLGQYSVSLVVDHFGFFRFPHSPINRHRIAGVLLIFLGVILITELQNHLF
jgi:transporter family-2 protein